MKITIREYARIYVPFIDKAQIEKQLKKNLVWKGWDYTYDKSYLDSVFKPRFSYKD